MSLKNTAKLLLVFLMIFSLIFTGCNGSTPDTPNNGTTTTTQGGDDMQGNGENNKPQKSTNGFSQFEITYYWGPHGETALDESYWKAIAECGFTSVPLEMNTTANNKAALSLMKKYGLTCSSLWDSRVQMMIHKGDSISQEELESTVKAVVDDYAAYDNIVGWWLQDEPNSDLFPILSRLVAAFKKYDPTRETFIDLFPVYADPAALKTKDYNEYVDRHLNEVNPSYLCYDHYHFMENEPHRKQFFENFEIIRQKSLDKNLDYMSIVLLTKHWAFANLTRSQILWETNMCLTYGAKRISYFTFILDPDLLADNWDNACMSSVDGTKYPHYYDVQAINKNTAPLGKELFNKRSTAVFHLTNRPETLEEGCEEYVSYGDLRRVSGENFVIGFFDDGSFMVTNKKFEEGDDGKNTITLRSVIVGLEYFDTATGEWKAYNERNANGNYVFNANGGEAMLFRVG